jgi:hypothetical protein
MNTTLRLWPSYSQYQQTTNCVRPPLHHYHQREPTLKPPTQKPTGITEQKSGVESETFETATFVAEHTGNCQLILKKISNQGRFQTKFNRRAKDA